jgi:hypothetical protein
MRMEAIRQKTPSQISSAEPQMSRARVYQTAINAAPIQIQTPNPRSDPNHIYKMLGSDCWKKRGTHTCFVRRFRSGSSSSPIAFRTNDNRTETIIAASRVSRVSARSCIGERTSEYNEKYRNGKHIDSHCDKRSAVPRSGEIEHQMKQLRQERRWGVEKQEKYKEMLAGWSVDSRNS